MDHRIGRDKAAENLAAAQSGFDHGRIKACANRLCCARLHAGIAAFADAGLLPASGRVGHDWLQANFSSRFIHRRNSLPARFKSYLPAAYRVRALADYEAISVSKNMTVSELKKAKECVDAVKLEVCDATQS